MYSLSSISQINAPCARENVSGTGRLIRRTFELTPPAITRERRVCAATLLLYRSEKFDSFVDMAMLPLDNNRCRPCMKLYNI